MLRLLYFLCLLHFVRAAYYIDKDCTADETKFVRQGLQGALTLATDGEQGVTGNVPRLKEWMWGPDDEPRIHQNALSSELHS